MLRKTLKILKPFIYLPIRVVSAFDYHSIYFSPLQLQTFKNVISVEGEEYIATNDDPQFIFESGFFGRMFGWYEIKVIPHKNNFEFYPRLYLKSKRAERLLKLMGTHLFINSDIKHLIFFSMRLYR